MSNEDTKDDDSYLILPMPESTDADPYLITSSTRPEYEGFDSVISNGFIGHRLHSTTVYVGGLYNGLTITSHRARVQCTIPYVSSDTPPTKYTVNCREGTYTMEGKGFHQTFYAHALYNRVFVTTITVINDKVILESHQGDPSVDLDVEYSGDILDDVEDDALKTVQIMVGTIKEPETATSTKTRIYVVSTMFPKALTKGVYTFGTSIAFTEKEAMDYYKLYGQVPATLLKTHTDVWSKLWSTSNIDLTTQTTLSTNLKAAMYYMLSQFPAYVATLVNWNKFTFNGVSPGGLGNGGKNEDYWGHVFWDQDLWMLPGIVLLFPEFVRQSLLYRIRMLPGARVKARKNGYLGAMYPWESARTGTDVCPGEIYAKYQQHVTACVVYAIRQYCYAVGSFELLTTDGAWDVVKDTADFWVSRVEWDGSNFVINHVMDPDEYHYDVNNSCFTNAAARLNLLFAIEAAEVLEKVPDPRWVAVSQEKHGIKIPFDEKMRYHPEFDGYIQGALIKQASVVLLGYPLGYEMPDDVRRNDILFYESCTDKGPGMTYSMYSIGMLELDDDEEAGKLFKVQFNNIREPFKVWNEYPDAYGCTNFMTGIGGFLQSFLYGYLGIRVTKIMLFVKPNLPPDCTVFSPKGISYHSEKFDFNILLDNSTVTRTTGTAFAHMWYISKVDGSERQALVTGEPVKISIGGSYKISSISH